MRNFTIVIFVFLSLIETLSAQIGTLSLGFTQACASTSFNTYNVTFSYTGVFGPTNQFMVEFSDATGSFSNPTVVTSNVETITATSVTLSFSIPTTTAGETYKIRIKSTAPAATSSNSVAFAAYYKIQDTPFSINNLISTGTYCTGGNYLLTIDNPGTGSNDSPLKYPSLTFKWYKETSPTTSVFVASGSTLSVNQSGTYYVETNYGTCTSNSFSNRVTISEAGSGNASSINSSLGNPFCSSEGLTTLSTINGNSYKWFKDGVEITGAVNQTYQTDQSGTYSVTVSLGSCASSASINLQTNGFDSSIDVPETNTIQSGGSLVATVTTTASNPEFKWYLNNTLITGATGNSYEATQLGDYKVVIKQTVGCIASNEFLFSINEPFPDVAKIPNLISPNGDGINDTWIIPKEYVNGTNAEVVIMSSQGKVVFQTNNYQNNWPENEIKFSDINPVYYYIITTQNNKIKKGSITVVK